MSNREIKSILEKTVNSSKKDCVTPPTRHRVSFFFSSRINFKLVHSYNVKHLTLLYSVAVDYKIYIQVPYVEVFNIYNIYIGLQNSIYKIDLKVFQWAPIDAWPLTADVDCPIL